MKICAVILAIEDKCTLYHKDVALKLNKEYYNHFDIELRIMDKTFIDVNKMVTWNKTLLFEIYNDIDFVIAQDLDIIPCSKEFNIVDFLALNEINLAVDSTVFGESQYKNGVSFPHFRYNAGLTCYPKRYQKIFKQIYDFGSDDPHSWGTGDQYYINEYLGKNNLFVNEIPQRFNTFFNPNINYNKLSFVHYTNYMGSHDKLSFIEKYHPKELLNVHT